MSTRAVFTDGGSKTNVITQVYDVNSGASYVAGKGRFGGVGVQVGVAGWVGVNFANNPQTVIGSFAVQLNNLPTSPAPIWSAEDTNLATTQCLLAWMPSGQLQFYRGPLTAAVGSPSAASFPANSIIQLQIKAKIDPTTGTLDVRLNGDTSSICTFTGNTRTSANSYASRQYLGGHNIANPTAWYSDVILFDTGGSAPNDWLGNKRVYTLLPIGDSATGGLNQFTPSPSQSAGSHYLNVDQEPPPGDTAYNADATVSDRESYQIAALPGGAAGVSGVNIWAMMRIDDAGPHTVSLTSRSNAVDSIGPALNIAASYTYYPFFQATDPNTGSAWVAGNVGGTGKGEIGVKIIS